MPFPSGVTPPFSKFIPRQLDGKIINLEINKFGFPQLWEHRTKIFDNGIEFNTTYRGDWAVVGSLNSNGNIITHRAARSSDLAKASTWAMSHYPSGKVRRSKTPTSTSSTKIDILRDGGDPLKESDWITQTWHHHENGKGLVPIPSELHNPLVHSGGHAARFGSDGTHANQTVDTNISELFNYGPNSGT